MKQPLLYLLLLVIIGNLQAQKLENINIQQVDGNIILSFDLLPQESIKEKYDLEITSSADGHSKILEVLNASTKNVSPKNRLQYTIDGATSFTGYKGNLNFRVKATLVYSPLRFLSPKDKVSVKKGKSMELKWNGGNDNSKYNLDLYKSGMKFSTIESKFSAKNTSWLIPKNLKKGSDYSIRLEVDGNTEQSAFTNNFKVKGKIPVLVKALPLLIIGGVIAVISGGDNTETKIPLPPELPE